MNYLSVFKVLAPTALVLGVCYALYSTGYNNGVESVTIQWEAEKQVAAVELARVEGEFNAKTKDHEYETVKLQQTLALAEARYNARLDDVARDYADRLRLSEARAGRYQTAAEAGPTQCGHLARYAAELDRSLEQGRSLVRELGATVEQRDQQVIALAEQIRIDRKLVGE